MKIEAAKLSCPGSRDVNEDYICMDYDEKNGIFILADGLGGHGMGDIASKLAAEAAMEVLLSGKAIEEAFESAEEAVMRKQEAEGEPDKMKTTLCILVIRDGKASVGHIGDSRVYFFKNRKYVKRTPDHSVPQMLYESGDIKEEEIRFHADRNRLLKVIGVEWDEPQYEIDGTLIISTGGLFHRRIPDAFVLCSDGWWELVTEKEMMKALEVSDSPRSWLEEMKRVIEEKGAGTEMDNYSAVAVFV